MHVTRPRHPPPIGSFALQPGRCRPIPRTVFEGQPPRMASLAPGGKPREIRGSPKGDPNNPTFTGFKTGALPPL